MNRRTAIGSIAAVAIGSVTGGCIGSVRPPHAGSDPDEDVDGDGFTVREERHCLDSAEVGRMDVFVEVDWMEGYRPDPGAMERLIEVYDEAPVSASRGANPGVNLHIEYGTELPAKSIHFDRSVASRYADDHFANRGRGYHYALFVDVVGGNENVLGLRPDPGVMVIEAGNDERSEGFPVQVFAHELGHSLGLKQDVFDGIDSTTRLEEYPSVMTYAAMGEQLHLDFSDGSNSENDFDDWGYLEENLYVPDKSELDPPERC